jgi:hypothetical protein
MDDSPNRITKRDDTVGGWIFWMFIFGLEMSLFGRLLVIAFPVKFVESAGARTGEKAKGDEKVKSAE